MGEIKKFYYIDAVTPSVGSRICEYFFDNYFDRLEKNNKERTYDVFLIKPKDEKSLEELKDDIQDFRDFWGAGYVFYFSENK